MFWIEESNGWSLLIVKANSSNDVCPFSNCIDVVDARFGQRFMSQSSENSKYEFKDFLNFLHSIFQARTHIFEYKIIFFQ